MHLPQRFLFCFWLFAFFMQNKNVLWARLCDKLKSYDSFSHHNSFVFSLILTWMISFENSLKNRIQWYNNRNNTIKTIEMTKLWSNLPSNHLKPQMYDSVYFRHNALRCETKPVGWLVGCSVGPSVTSFISALENYRFLSFRRLVRSSRCWNFRQKAI